MITQSRIWEAIGKLALVITVIVGGVQLWQHFSQSSKPPATSGPQLEASVAYFGFNLPPDIVLQTQKLRNLADSSAAEDFVQAGNANVLQTFTAEISGGLDHLLLWAKPDEAKWKMNGLMDALQNDADRSKRFLNSLRYSLKDVLTEYASSGWTKENRYEFPAYRSYVVVNVRNIGDKRADGVELQLPYYGVAMFEELGEKPRSVTFDHKLALGSFQPKGEKKLHLWTILPVSDYSFTGDEWKVTYGDGIGKIVPPRRN
jgi:hypothetical protein